MRSTEIQTTPRSGVASFASHAPIHTPPVTGGYPYGTPPRTAGPSHNRVAIIGATGLVALLAVMGGIAYLRAQEASVPTAAPVVATAAVAAAVPHAATIALSDALADGPIATMPVPHGAAPIE